MPHCAVQVEDKAHILMCPDPQVHQLWIKSLKQIEEWLKQEGKDGHIREQPCNHYGHGIHQQAQT